VAGTSLVPTPPGGCGAQWRARAVPLGAVTLLHRDPSYMETAGEAAFSLVRAALTSR